MELRHPAVAARAPHLSNNQCIRIAIRPLILPAATTRPVRFLVRITNQAAAPQDVLIDATPLPDGWTIAVPITRLTMPPRSHTDVPVLVTRAADAGTGDRIGFRVRVRRAIERTRPPVSQTLRQSGDPLASQEADESRARAGPGRASFVHAEVVAL